MARYIDAEELCRRINECWETNNVDKGRLIQQVIDRVITPIVVGTPTADVEEVVRCKDCKYFRKGLCIKTNGMVSNNPFNFCSYGERKLTKIEHNSLCEKETHESR